MKLELVAHDDPILTKPTDEWDFENPPMSIYDLTVEMSRILIENRALGLAAPQVGVPYALFLITSSPQPQVFVNPHIVARSDEEVMLEEGCLSYPGLVVKIKRPKHVRVRAADAFGQVSTNLYTGMTARTILHEYDHLDGVPFFKNANRFHRDQAFRQWKHRNR